MNLASGDIANADLRIIAGQAELGEGGWIHRNNVRTRLLGEIRGAEAYSFLRAINTGHPGSITTVHADSSAGAFEQLALMVMQAGLGLRRDEIIAYIKSVRSSVW